ncbi:hypothetical protein [Massilibacteroides sp.]|uniref:hypothetical protein n=1 Tax=Massilibacteroides sp. TaxID=2034766 RepID=UPI002621529D|nr:hypothetical protein [Massilibacteroides sp.]MDD4515650.1 hypothetical protein [Massilibacteroides sp.]
MILVRNKDNGTELTFDNEILFNLAKDFANLEIVNKNVVEEPPIVEEVEVQKPVVKVIEKTAIKQVVLVKKSGRPKKSL